jgi:uncharacterized protein YfaS (alpha-2-macroglobulin family)
VGSVVFYPVTLKNNDSTGCSTSSVALTSAAPQGWPSAFNTTTLNLAPGQSGTATLTKSVPPGTMPGTYAIDAVASDGARTVAAGANCTATLPPAPLTVTVAASAASYAARSTVSMTATVKNGTAPANGATVTFTMVEADGTQNVKSVRTGSDGTASWSYKLGPNDKSGAYSVSASATLGNQSGASSPVTFTVQ